MWDSLSEGGGVRVETHTQGVKSKMIWKHVLTVTLNKGDYKTTSDVNDALIRG